MAKVSIVVPVYNVEKYLAKCLDSLLSQTYKDIKIIVVNDGSPDNSQNIIDEYQKNNPELIESYIKENGGLSDARNYGLKYVDSEYVCFVDSDDYVENNLVERCIETIEKDESDLVHFNYCRDNFETNEKEDIISRIEAGVYNLEEENYILAYTANAAWNKMYKTKLFKDNNIEFPKGLLYEDLATTTRILPLCKKVSYIDDILYHYQVSRSGQIMSKVSDDIITVCEYVVDYYKKNDLFDKYYSEIDYLCKINVIDALRNLRNVEDKNYIEEFIDKAFDFLDKNFKKKNIKYDIILKKIDNVYLNRNLCKLYYKIKKKI